MNVEALTQLRRVISDAPDELLHMRAIVKEAKCGTARCAIGWCFVDPWFIENTSLPAFEKDILDGDWDYLEELFSIAPASTTNLFGGALSPWGDEHAVSKGEVLANIDALLAGEDAVEYAACSEDIYDDTRDGGEEEDV